MIWRKVLHPSLKPHLEHQIRETFKHRKVIRRSSDPKNAQLWVAIANISKDMAEIKQKLGISNTKTVVFPSVKKKIVRKKGR